jgi:cytochrome c oxidase assembly factor CtaG
MKIVAMKAMVYLFVFVKLIYVRNFPPLFDVGENRR